MTPEDLEALQTRYTSDADLRRRIDEAASAEEAIALLKESGFDATASDLAQLQGAYVEIDLELIDQLSGGALEDGHSDFNFTFC